MHAELVSLDDLKRLIVDSLQLEGVNPEEIGDDDPLFGEGLGLDSVDALELVVAMEKRFQVKINSEEMDPKVFRSVSGIHRFITDRIAEERGASQ